MFSDRILMKDPETRKYIPLPEFMRKYGRVVLEYKPAANMIQVRTVEEGFDGLLHIGRSLGALKHDFR